MAATSHPQATLAALDILKAGGNAMDAAIAAVALQGVVEPQMTGIGGDCFVLYSPRAGAPVSLNGSGRTPAKTDLAKTMAKGAKALTPTSIEARKQIAGRDLQAGDRCRRAWFPHHTARRVRLVAQSRAA